MAIKNSLHLAALMAFAIASSLNSQAQTLEKLNASFDGEKMIVTYGLVYADPNQKFKVALYSSHDNYKQPILVTGDAGENVLPGKAKRAVWDASRALAVDFDGDIQIKIKTSRMAAPTLALEPLALKTYKRGRTISLKWTGGYADDKMQLVLMKDEKVIRLAADQLDNTTAYDWKMPKKVKGKNFTLRLASIGRPNELIVSEPFRVKPRVPFIVKMLPVFVAGAAVIIFGPGGDNPLLGGGDDKLPEPPTKK